MTRKMDPEKVNQEVAIDIDAVVGGGLEQRPVSATWRLGLTRPAGKPGVGGTSIYGAKYNAADGSTESGGGGSAAAVTVTSFPTTAAPPTADRTADQRRGARSILSDGARFLVMTLAAWLIELAMDKILETIIK